MSALAPEPVQATFDLGEVLPGRIQEDEFKQALEGRDWSAYRGREVTLTGCAPLWAYLYVACRIAPYAAGLVVTDGSATGVRIK